MQIVLNIPSKYDSYDQTLLEKKLNKNIEKILFELELLEDYKEAQTADDSRFYNL